MDAHTSMDPFTSEDLLAGYDMDTQNVKYTYWTEEGFNGTVQLVRMLDHEFNSEELNDPVQKLKDSQEERFEPKPHFKQRKSRLYTHSPLPIARPVYTKGKWARMKIFDRNTGYMLKVVQPHASDAVFGAAVRVLEEYNGVHDPERTLLTSWTRCVSRRCRLVRLPC